MVELKATPGPWVTRLSEEGWIEIVSARDSDVVADVWEARLGLEEQTANANLLSTAHEMYEALEESNRHLVGELGINHPIVKRNREVLAKARGES